MISESDTGHHVSENARLGRDSELGDLTLVREDTHETDNDTDRGG